ncbi:MAG: hypothetical protein J1F71_02600 [Clostridiales bacterium]|nr:hypothetical protein [Clostridiales bacterium]
MKQKILLTYVESGFGHISSMDSIYDALLMRYSDKYDIQKSFILTEDGFSNLVWMNKFLIKQVQNTNKIPFFGRFVFPFIAFLGGHKLVRFFHRQMAHKSFLEGLEALKKRKPNIIISNHYFTNLLAVEYKRRIDPDVVIINYNPDPTLHTFWDRRDGIFIVDNPLAYKKALKYKFKEESLRLVTPCVRQRIEKNTLSREQLREKFDLPKDKFTVVVADGGYMMGRGPKFAKALIKKGLPITLCVIAGHNKKQFDYFKAIERGEGKLKLSPEMTLKTYEFLDNAYELYGAADLFLTKGGPNAVLDSIYMHTPVMINYAPHVIEAGTVKVFIGVHGCGETAFRPRKAIKRIRRFLDDKSDLVKYDENIEKLIAEGNGISAVADVVEQEADKQRLKYEARGITVGDPDDPDGNDGGSPSGGMPDMADEHDADINIVDANSETHAEGALR